jgi:hypothetical protein
MAMFGMTSFGPQDAVKNNLLRELNIASFTEEEFSIGFDHVDSMQSGYLESHEIRAVFTRVYGTEPAEFEVEKFLEMFPVGAQITKDEFIKAIAEVKVAAAKIDKGSATEFDSNLDYQLAIHKHTRLQYGPKERYRVGMLESHKYGWKVASDIEKTIDRRPKKNCDETTYAAEMIKTGIYF